MLKWGDGKSIKASALLVWPQYDSGRLVFDLFLISVQYGKQGMPFLAL